MKLARLFGLLLAIALAASSAQAQPCLHGSDETTAQKERKHVALGAVRLINTAELEHFVAFDRYATWAELVASPLLAKFKESEFGIGAAYKAMKLSGEADVLPGYELRLTTDGKAYSLLLRDKTDPCLFTLYSDQVGVIYYGQPIDRRPPRRRSIEGASPVKAGSQRSFDRFSFIASTSGPSRSPSRGSNSTAPHAGRLGHGTR